jgi:hypothetical protein
VTQTHDHDGNIHRDFTCTADEKTGRITAKFTPELVDHGGKTRAIALPVF